MHQLEVRLFGIPHATLNGHPLGSFRAQRTKALFYYFVVEPDVPHARDLLGTMFWPESTTAAARQSVRQSLFQIRKLLAANDADDAADGLAGELIAATRSAIAFQPTPACWSDVAEFAHLLTLCQQHDHDDAVACPVCADYRRRLVDLYQGEFLDGLYLDDAQEFEDWLLLRREWYRQQMLQALTLLAEHHLVTQDFAAAERYAQRQIQLDPLRENAYRQAMVALTRDGRQDEALDIYQQCATVLYTELNLTPDAETVALHNAIRTTVGTDRVWPPSDDDLRALDNVRQPRAPLHNLPARTTTVYGRSGESAALVRLLQQTDCQLVTVRGSGGMGKTTLLVETGFACATLYPDGVWLVPLTGVTVADDASAVVVAHAVAMAIGRVLRLDFGSADPQKTVTDYLRSRHILLLLDNMEHLLQAKGFIQGMLDKAPNLAILATSHENLDLPTERIFVLDGLPIPDTHSPGHLLRQSPGVLLFVDSAKRLMDYYEPDDADLSYIVEICRLLQGMPLGIELAASWVEQFTCAEIRDAIKRDFGFLDANFGDLPSRHRSLRALFDHTWQMLSGSEQSTLAHLSIFSLPVSRVAALSITNSNLADLVSLARKSVIQQDAGGYFLVHPLVRHFAAEKMALQPQNQQTRLRRRFVTYFLRGLHGREQILFGPNPGAATESLQAEHAHLVAAWGWGVEQAMLDELALAVVPFSRFYDLVGLSRQAEDLFSAALANLPSAGAAAKQLRVSLLVEIAHAQNALAHYSDARTSATEALALWRPGYPSHLRANSLCQAGRAHYRLGETDSARLQLVAAVEIARKDAWYWIWAESLLALGDVIAIGAGEDATATYTQSLELYRHIGDRRGEASALNCLGTEASRHGQNELAQQFIEEALDLHRAVGDQRNECIDLNNLGNLYAYAGNYAASEHLLEQAARIARQIGYLTGVVTSGINRGFNALDQGDPHGAEDRFAATLPLARDIAYVRAEAMILGALADLAHARHDLDDAVALHTEAVVLYKKIGDRTAECGQLSALVTVLHEDGRYGDALRSCADALALAQALDNHAMVRQFQCRRGRLALALFDLTQADTAFRTLLAPRSASSEDDGQGVAGAVNQGAANQDDDAGPLAATIYLAAVARLRGNDLNYSQTASSHMDYSGTVQRMLTIADTTESEMLQAHALTEAALLLQQTNATLASGWHTSKLSVGGNSASIVEWGQEKSAPSWEMLATAAAILERTGPAHAALLPRAGLLAAALDAPSPVRETVATPLAESILKLLNGAFCGDVTAPFFVYATLHQALSLAADPRAERVLALGGEHCQQVVSSLASDQVTHLSGDPAIHYLAQHLSTTKLFAQLGDTLLDAAPPPP